MIASVAIVMVGRQFYFNNTDSVVTNPVELFKVNNSSDFDSNQFTEELMEEEGVRFAKVNMLIHFMETSFCKGVTSRGYPTLCSYEWENILGIQWNPHNYIGMKYPKNRKTTSIGSVGSVLRDLIDKHGITLPNKYKFLLNDPHAVYTSPRECAKDLKLWQESRLPRFERDVKKITSDVDYMNALQYIGYNPYKKYYVKLGMLYDQWATRDFHERYGIYYEKNTGGKLK